MGTELFGRMGFYFGKFIYLLDAYDDVEEDVKKGNYNPFSKDYIIKGFDDRGKEYAYDDDGRNLPGIRETSYYKIYRYSSEYPVFRSMVQV